MAKKMHHNAKWLQLTQARMPAVTKHIRMPQNEAPDDAPYFNHLCLSCQIPVSDKLNSLIVRLPRARY